MNSQELVCLLVLGMMTVLVFCREGQSVFPCFCCFGNESRLWLHVGTCATGSQNSGNIWNFGKQFSWLFVVLSMHLMLVGCLIALMVLCLRPGECRECGSITSRACRTG